MASILERIRLLKEEIARVSVANRRGAGDGRVTLVPFGVRIASLAAQLYGEDSPRYQDARQAADDFPHGRGSFSATWGKLMAILATMEDDATKAPSGEERSRMRPGSGEAADTSQVFISYSRSDGGFVNELRVKVEEVGIPPG